MTTTRKKEDLTAKPCPKCGAAAGDACTRENGKPPPFGGWTHKERIMLVRYGLMPDQVAAQAQIQMAQITGEPVYAWTCCDYGWADVAALDRHRSSGHTPPSILGLHWTEKGWSSR
jgi:hypothetical protein